MSRRTQRTGEIFLEKPSLRRQAEYLEAARRSTKLHGRWVQPARTVEKYRELLKRARAANRLSHFVCHSTGALVGDEPRRRESEATANRSGESGKVGAA